MNLLARISTGTLVSCVGLLAADLLAGATIHVDNKLAQPCKGNYSIARRDSSGADGDAYRTIVEAADAAQAGDTVLIRQGVYHSSQSLRENDVLWPKRSGQPGRPIVFKAYRGEPAVLGDGPTDYPDEQISIARGVITLKGVSHIVIEGLQVRKVAGWIYARGCQNVVIRNCTLEDAMHGAKGTARFLECQHLVIDRCAFRNSSFDSVQLEKCDRGLIENCTFWRAEHSLLAIRGSSFNVVRACRFDNPYFEKGRAEKLIEVYDVKADRREPDSPAYIAPPAYDSTKHNLFERNLFGYHPFRPKVAAQPSAMQYSGQEGIIRFNVFCNPVRRRPDAEHPDAAPGGLAIAMRWGGSWDGWNPRRNWWMGEGHEAGFVTGNRVFHNTFYGYDNGCVAIPSEDGIKGIMNPPPMEHKNPPKVFHKRFEFADNLFVNNIFMAGPYLAHTNWAWQQHITGKPVAVTALGLLKAVRFLNNDFYATGPNREHLIYVHTSQYPPPGSPEQMGRTYPDTFVGNLNQDPQFMDLQAADFRLKAGSPLIDAGAPLTVTIRAGRDSRRMAVKDVRFFFDGFGIEGQTGDLVQLHGQSQTARVVGIDYAARTLGLDRPLSWAEGQGVSLAFAGRGPDVGAYEWRSE